LQGLGYIVAAFGGGSWVLWPRSQYLIAGSLVWGTMVLEESSSEKNVLLLLLWLAMVLKD
jgi:hypothetical protein